MAIESKKMIAHDVIEKNLAEFMFLVQNAATQTVICDPKKIVCNGLEEKGLSLLVPLKSCGQGHNLALKIFSKAALEKLKRDPSRKPSPAVTAVAKVNSITDGPGADMQTITIQFFQYDPKEWKAFKGEIENEQDSINKTLNTLKR